MAYRKVSDDSLIAVADAIRAKNGTANRMSFPNGFVSAVESIQVGSDPVLQTKEVTPSTYSQTVIPDVGYDGLSHVTVGAIPGAHVGSDIPRKTAATYTPGTIDQTIASGQYLTGAQTVKGDTNLIPANIKSGVSIFSVTGSYTGSGESSGDSFDLKGFLEKTLTTLILPSDLTKIGAYGLYKLEYLRGISIPAGVTDIGAYAMYGCTNLTMVSFEGTPNTIATAVFSNCNNLMHIYVPWAEGAVANAPWGATRATIHYNT